MASYNINSYTAQIVEIPFSTGQQLFVMINVDPGTDNITQGDVLNFPTTFATDLTQLIQGFVAVCAISVFREPNPNKWGFGNTSVLGGSNGEFRLTTALLGSGTYIYVEIELEYKVNSSWYKLGYVRNSAGAFLSDDNYYTSPVIIIRNVRNGKYFLFSSTSVGCASYDSIDPGIINKNGIPVSLIAINGQERQATACNVVISSQIETEEIVPKTDPFSPGGISDTGGGSGYFDGTSVDIDFSSLPTLSAVDTGFITLYNPSLTQLQSLASYMWSGLFDIDTLKKLFADPMQAILGLSIVPGPVPNGGTQNVKIGNVDSGVEMTKAASQYIDIDCGTLNVEEFWGAYLDYEPYTKAEIFLPFIGVHQIAVDDIMNKPVHIKYHIDLLSGACTCEIKCGGSVIYTFIGSCAVSIPVTGNDWTNLLNGVLSAASAIGSMVATGGASAPAALGTLASTAVNSLKPSIEKSGSIAGAGGLLAGKVPVLILTRPRQALPANQNKYTGYPAFITRSLGSLSGYTEIHSIRLSGIDGTEAEIDEIEELLKGGVIL